MNWNDDYLNDIWMHGSRDIYIYRPNRKQKRGRIMSLEAGDRVKLRHGSRTLIVQYIQGPYVHARYEHNGQTIRRLERELVVLDNETEQEGKGTMKGKLFQTNEDTPRFGVGLAVDSQGKYVLEMKSSGGIETFNATDVEIVMPFTFAVKFGTGNQEYQYLGKEGSVEEGDLLLAFDTKHAKGGISIAQVTKVNTKSDRATKYFKGAKIKTEPLV